MIEGHDHLCANFVRRAQNAPDAMFAVLVKAGNEQVLSNAWVLRRALTIRAALVHHDVRPGDLVTIVLEHGADLYPSFIGCMLGGFVPAFLPPLTTKQDPEIFRSGMAALFARTLPAALLTSARSLVHVSQGGYAVLCLEDIAQTGLELAIDSLDLPRTDTAFLQHSSGTTGLKKGVMLSHRTVLEQVTTYAASLEIVVGDIVASWLPLYHDMGLITSFMLPLVIGCPIISLDALEWVVRPTMLLDAIARHKAAFSWLPNFAFHHMLRAVRPSSQWDLGSLKALVNCSEPCRTDTFDQFAVRFGAMGIEPARLRVCYAMAETVFAITQTVSGAIARKGRQTPTSGFLSCGAPLPGVEIEIRDPNGNHLATDMLGEICIRSTMLFDGYFKQPDVTAEKLRDGWFHTSDLGCMEDGELFVLGRVDDLLIVNGRNLFAHEIESIVTTLPGIAPGRVLASADFDPRMGAIRLFILAERNDQDIDAKALEADIRQAVLASTGIFPGGVQFLPRGFLVKSSSGKIARAQSLRKHREHTG
jgi:acyl-CoA synthetase (AMP-forming)/AMP-acid ligase II